MRAVGLHPGRPRGVPARGSRDNGWVNVRFRHRLTLAALALVVVIAIVAAIVR
ncbi:MAG: hypothetical protein IPM08_07295 [Actinomycetales bacterium]|nr:hypothetical protein [Actinomycetales bacterium]